MHFFLLCIFWVLIFLLSLYAIMENCPRSLGEHIVLVPLVTHSSSLPLSNFIFTQNVSYSGARYPDLIAKA